MTLGQRWMIEVVGRVVGHAHSAHHCLRSHRRVGPDPTRARRGYPMNLQPPPDRYGTGCGDRHQSRWSGWKIVGVVLATVLGLCGLALLMVVILFAVAINSSGSNK